MIVLARARSNLIDPIQHNSIALYPTRQWVTRYLEPSLTLLAFPVELYPKPRTGKDQQEEDKGENDEAEERGRGNACTKGTSRR
jgi:hypothetical protein